MACSCSEGFIEGRAVDTGVRARVRTPGHDCAYVAARNALIPVAEARANARWPDDRMVGYAARWTGTFVREMQLLAREKGIA